MDAGMRVWRSWAWLSLALFFGAFVAWALGVKGCGVTESLGLGSKHGRGVVW